MTKADDLLVYLFAGREGLEAGTHPLAPRLLGWMEASPRFTAFVESYRDKIRKKVRVARDPEQALDLQAELEAAARLLADRRLEVAYEPYASAKRRGPDFAITYRAGLVFNLEVSRLGAEGDPARGQERLLRTVLDKLGQMQPGMANLLVIRCGESLVGETDLGRLMGEVKARAERKDPAFYTAGHYPGPAAFYKDFLRLSGVLLWAGRAQAWANRQARPGLDEKVLRQVAVLLAQASGG